MPTRSLAVIACILATAGCGSRPAAHADGHDDYHPDVRAVAKLRTATTTAGQPIRFPAPVEMIALEVTIPPGAETGWHRHPQPGFAYVLSGRLRVELADGTAHDYGAGDAFAEVIDLAHNGRALGPEPVRLIAWFAAAPGAAPTIKEPAPPRR